MELTIDGKAHNFHFGIKFLSELDKAHELTEQGMSFGAGLEQTLPKLLLMNDPATLVEYLKMANKTEKTVLSESKIIDYLEGLTEDEYDALFEKVSEELEAVPAVSKKVKALKKQLQAAK